MADGVFLMIAITRVDLHSHSTFSDGMLTPEQLAERLDAAGVGFVALTDHDTVDGLTRFRAAASRRGMAAIAGVEITTQCDDREAHLLAYGFEPAHLELLATLQSLRQTRQVDVHDIARNLRQRAIPAASAAPDGRLAIADAIALVHRAGGKAFLAHPLLLERDPHRLNDLLLRLKGDGLDGIEALYAPFTPAQQQELLNLAAQLGLLVSGGADTHGNAPRVPQTPLSIDMPTDLWKAFRDAVTSGRPAAASPPAASPTAATAPRARTHLRPFIFHIIVPTMLAMLLFGGAVFGLLLPTLEQALLDRKREMIHELTSSAWSILAEAHRQEQSGELTRDQAQAVAKQRVGALRYGRESKDYFWIQDLHPRILMHPYREDLNDQDVSDFRDARGVRIFVEFADLVRRKREGYIKYVWQWKDDPRRLAPKESYIRGFEPWGWIIGTGIYTEDVKQEIERIEHNVVRASVAIFVLVALLLLYAMRESLRLEHERRDAEENLRESNERYRTLVEAATEGTLLVLGGRCRYANPLLLDMLGYREAELELCDLGDLLPVGTPNAAVWDAIAQLAGNEGLTPSVSDAMPGAIDGQLRRRDGSEIACILVLRRIEFAGRSGFILLARPGCSQPSPEAQRRALVDRLGQLPGSIGTDLSHEIAQARTAAEIIACCRRTGGLVRAWLDCGAHPRHITRMLATVCDAATERFTTLATDEQGPAPVPFAILALGSQGRQEQTLYTDQDNAIVYAGAFSEPTNAYFLRLGQRVCDWLNEAGYLYCRGEVMAKNPRWCQPYSLWHNDFTRWIQAAEPQELLHLSIFFDLRVVCGQAELASELWTHVRSEVLNMPAFLPHFARNSLLFRSPLGLFGRIMVGGGSGEHPGLLDLKQAMMPIVNFARLYALRHDVPQTNTLDRLAALTASGFLPESSHTEIATAYEFLMLLRLRQQAAAIAAGTAPDNLVDPSALSHIERAILKESFTEIEAIQKRISYDFLGGE